MEKKKYIRPAITVYNITPSVILAGSIRYASEGDYGGVTGSEYYGDSHHPDKEGMNHGDHTRGNPNAGYRPDANARGKSHSTVT